MVFNDLIGMGFGYLLNTGTADRREDEQGRLGVVVYDNTRVHLFCDIQLRFN